MSVDISVTEVKSLSHAIKRRYDLDFTNYEVKSFSRGLSRLITKHKMNSILDLWAKILNDADFFHDCIDDLTVNLTEMFRNPDAWEFFQNQIFSLYASRPLLKIWHAGCSTGEEVYTTAIVLKKMDLLKRSHAIASDLSTTAVESAKNGTYSDMLIKNYENGLKKLYPNEVMANHFNSNTNSATIKDEYKQYASFIVHNLVKEPIDGKFDIIFCRNVMIYFDNRLKIEVLKKFYNCLNDDGFLIIGYYDVMPEDIFIFFEVFENKTRVYKKKKLN